MKKALVLISIFSLSLFADVKESKKMDYLIYEGIEKDVVIYDEFGAKTKEKECLVFTKFLANSKKDFWNEFMILHSQIFNDEEKRIHHLDALTTTKGRVKAGAYGYAKGVMDVYQEQGQLPSSINVNTNNLQLKNSLLKVDRGISSINGSLIQYMSSSNEKASILKVKLLYSFFIAHNLIEEFPMNRVCKLRIDSVFIEPLLYFSRGFENKRSNKTRTDSIKLLLALEKGNSAETTKLLLSMPNVKKIYDTFNK